MRFLTNSDDPRKDGWAMYMAFMFDIDHLSQIEWRREWLKDKYIGKPKATAKYSSKQLRKMGMVGIYEYDNPAIERVPFKIGHPGGLYEFLRAGRFAQRFGSAAQTLSESAKNAATHVKQAAEEWETSALELKRAFESFYTPGTRTGRL